MNAQKSGHRQICTHECLELGSFERAINAQKFLNARKFGHRYFPSDTVWI